MHMASYAPLFVNANDRRYVHSQGCQKDCEFNNYAKVPIHVFTFAISFCID